MLLQVKNLRCGYGSLEVVHGASLHVCAGEIVGLLGANGAGKSSLLKSIVGLLPPRQGDIVVDGRSTCGQPAWRSISNSMVLVPEGKMIFADMTVRENLLIGGYHNPDRLMQLDLVLDRFPRLRERTQQLGGTLSGGEQQMLALGRAWMARPKLLLLDEPSLGLAPLLVKEVFNEIRKMRDLGMTMLLVEQNVTATLQVADRAYVMETGDIILEGEAADLLHNPEVKRAYLGKGGKERWV
jgi:branched-chain amino acid transport system ATP-binding protein